MKLLTMEVMSDEQGCLLLPSMTLKGLESEVSFSLQICMEEEHEKDAFCIPQILLEDAGIDPVNGIRIMTGNGIIAITQEDQSDIEHVLCTGGK